MGTEEVREQVRERYAAAAVAAASTAGRTALEVVEADSCCAPSDTGASCCSGRSEVDVTFGADFYTLAEQGEVPPVALAASLGCGNPTAVAELLPGERVLDLGSGGGIDVLLSVRRVGETLTLDAVRPQGA